MQTVVRALDEKLDTKNRMAVRNTGFGNDPSQAFCNEAIIPEPRERTVPFQISTKALSMMDRAVKNMKAGFVSEPLDLSAFKSQVDGEQC